MSSTGGWPPAVRVPAVWWALCAVLLGTAAVIVTAADGPKARTVALDDGTTWLVSSAVGQAALLDGASALTDGASAQVVTQIAVGRGDLTAARSGADAFVANATANSVTRIDGATYRKTTAPAPLGRAGEPLALFPGRSALYAVSATAGLVTIADPATLRVRGPEQSLGARVREGAALVDGAGLLWLIDSDSGDLIRVDDSGKHPKPSGADPAAATLVLAGGRVAVVDAAARTVRPVGADGAPGPATCLDIRRGDEVAVTGSPTQDRVYAVSDDRGVLLVSDLDRRSCNRAVDLGAARHRLGPAQEAAGRVFVPDYTTGEVAVVDLASGRVVARPKVLAGGGETVFELVPSSSFVFYNDPASERAGVIRLDGTTVEIQKYDPERPDAGLVPGGGPSGPSSGPGGSGSGGSGPSSAPPTTPPTTPATAPTPSPPTPSPSTPGTTGTVAIELSADRAAIGEQVTMRAVATNGTRIGTVRWGFDDGSADGGVQVSHSWSKAGQFTITARVTLADGRQAAPTARITIVAGIPRPDPTPTPGPDPTSSQSGQPDHPTTTSTGPTPTQTTQGSEPPTAELSLTEYAGTVTADASASKANVSGEQIASYAFNFTGTFGAPQSAPQASRYFSYGTYQISVRVTDTAGRTAETTRTILVRDSSFTLIITPEGPGGVRDSRGQMCLVAGARECTGIWDLNDTVTLTAVPNSGATFVGWSGDCTPQGLTCTVTATRSDLGVTATFAEPTPNRTLSVTANGPGRVTGGGISCPGTCSVPVADGTSVTLTAAGDGGDFTGWSGDCSGTQPCTVTLSGGDRSVTATFVDSLVASLRWVDDGSPLPPYGPIYAVLDASASSGAVAYNFDYGDGTGSTGWITSSRAPRHAYNTEGPPGTSWTATVTIRDASGREKSATTSIYVKCC
ncbi:PKD domain-containing protein [Parafrankia sp. EUN1f]|uniref:PKD domain-containing protein n=1 Tax=Parafrankia sp. EUN1f TaxID=102897 RepID=UPI0001C44A2A|nr:PKD domain-containing protein [Parafrankia sp. EUN1f]EFC85053.1 PKD domain containing protein [Parafrankia sp. EUN1f]